MNELKAKGRKLDARWDQLEHYGRDSQVITKVIVKGAVDVIFNSQPDHRLVVAGKNMHEINQVETTFKGETLFIERVGASVDYVGGSFKPAGFLKRFLRMFGLGGNFDSRTTPAMVCISQHTAPALTHKGAGDVWMKNINQHTLTLCAEGVVDIMVGGEVLYLNAEIKGAGNFDLTGIAANTARLSISGAGSITAAVSDEVTNLISGAGNIAVDGNPMKRSQAISGAGRVDYV